jgi:chromosomal replication initiator protein
VQASPHDIVARIQDQIAAMVGPQRYRVWFKNSTRLTLADGYLRVGVPNLFVGNWIENHFADVLTEAAKSVTGREINLTFSIDDKLLGGLRKRQLDSQAEFIAKNTERVARHRRRVGPPPPKPLKGRFDDFVVGPSNQLVFSAARSVVEHPAARYNPLFVHGGCGLGKTHLLQAIGNELQEKRPATRWQYVSGEEFTNQFVYAIKTGHVESFRQRYRMLDVLLIDDIHFLANKRSTQEEFLHTFNAIDAAGKQVVMSSDTHPKLIGHLSEHLVTRFVSGMVVRIAPPELETRCEILRRRAARMKHQVGEEVIRYIAENLDANVRELEGALLKLIAFTTITHQPITLSLARHALDEHLSKMRRLLDLNDITSTVATYFGLTQAELNTSRKTRTIALARGIAMLLARRHTSLSFPEIGRFMGNKNHSTVILACRKLDNVLAENGTVQWSTSAGRRDASLGEILTELEEQLGKRPVSVS